MLLRKVRHNIAAETGKMKKKLPLSIQQTLKAIK